MLERPILIVDDSPEILAALRQILTGEHRLVFARDGREALAAVAKHNPALILLDVQMPGLDGYTVCRQLKQDPLTVDIPVIFITALSTVGHETEGFAAGGVDYIVKPISPPIVKARVLTHLSLVKATQLERSHQQAIHMLGLVGHYRDEDTGVHIWRMAAYAAVLADARGWSAANRQQLELAATLHDTGKLGIPDKILLKPGPLNTEEWAIMRTHSRIGHGILSRMDSPVFQLAAEIALYHHERWDGSGYPDGLAGEDIPESARIVAIADVFDALTMRRPYKEAWPVAQAMTEIREAAGQHFDPVLVEALEASLPKILTIKQNWDSRA